VAAGFADHLFKIKQNMGKDKKMESSFFKMPSFVLYTDVSGM
jgi:hypothetical protein